MSTNNEPKAPKAVLRLPKKTKDLITFARAVLSSVQNNPSFPNPNPSLDVVSTQIDELEDAETKAATRAKGAVSLRNEKKKKLIETLLHLRDYVQTLAETSTPAAAITLIESAFMSVRKVTKRPTPELRAQNADVSGKVQLTAKAVASMATYAWEHSVDQSTWTRLPETMQVRTEVAGLTSAKVYYFRFRALTRTGWQDYSQVVSLVVH